MQNKIIEAMGQLDDELILEAEGQTRQHRLLQLFPIALAACLCLVCLSALGRGLNTPRLFVGDFPVGGAQVPVNSLQTADLLPRTVDEGFSADFVIIAKKEVTISVSEGNLALNSDGICNNGKITAQGDIRFSWTIDFADLESEYKLSLSDGKGDFVLSYDRQLKAWTICKN